MKDFADKQSDIGTKAAFRLICVLEQTAVPQDGKFGVFTANEVIDALEPCFGSTPAIAKLREKFTATDAAPHSRDEPNKFAPAVRNGIDITTE